MDSRIVAHPFQRHKEGHFDPDSAVSFVGLTSVVSFAGVGKRTLLLQV